MSELIQQLIAQSAQANPKGLALVHGDEQIQYSLLQDEVSNFAAGLHSQGIQAGDRVAIYLPKQPETVYGIFGAAAAGAAFVPVNPILKPRQVAHILKDSGARILLTSWQRLEALSEILQECGELSAVVLVDEPLPHKPSLQQSLISYGEFIQPSRDGAFHARCGEDLAAILYTSGSTGNPKGVALSHRNLVLGAESVAEYLGNSGSDRILSVLPLSFDAGLSQLTTAFSAGSSLFLLNYLMPRDVIKAVTRHQITGLTAVPPLWNQLCELPWPDAAQQSLRYIASTGGAMPVSTTRSLQAALPTTDVFLMYGLTEAFRSTFLAPEEATYRPESIGKAIPNAEIYVVDDQGKECDVNVPGELVHCGPLVSMGYWQDATATEQRFKPAPRLNSPYRNDPAVWSGDTAYRDDEGYLYFVGRNDDMIKTSGYRVSPEEIEDIAMDSNLLNQATALGLPHKTLGQAILLLGVARQAQDQDCADEILAYCRQQMPGYMVPSSLVLVAQLPLNQNGKIDRAALHRTYQNYFNDPD
jgi:acyl-CoA ligase (AMP-forming) (exosortase A-associated)